jgi:hypothetical protein
MSASARRLSKADVTFDIAPNAGIQNTGGMTSATRIKPLTSPVWHLEIPQWALIKPIPLWRGLFLGAADSRR